MLQAVVVGIGGVLAPWTALADAEVEAAAAWLARRGTATARFARAAHGRHGEPAWLARALADAGVRLDLADRRALVLCADAAVPRPAPSPHRAALTALARSHRVAAVDAGAAPRMDAWLCGLRLADVVTHHVWTEDLGAAGRPPRPAPFRFLARRLDLHPGECLYVAGSAGLAAAARRAGFAVVAMASPALADFDWEGCVAAAMEAAG